MLLVIEFCETLPDRQERTSRSRTLARYSRVPSPQIIPRFILCASVIFEFRIFCERVSVCNIWIFSTHYYLRNKTFFVSRDYEFFFYYIFFLRLPLFDGESIVWALYPQSWIEKCVFRTKYEWKDHFSFMLCKFFDYWDIILFLSRFISAVNQSGLFAFIFATFARQMGVSDLCV